MHSDSISTGVRRWQVEVEEAPPEAVPDETQQEPTAEELEGMKDAQNTMQTETAGSNVSVADISSQSFSALSLNLTGSFFLASRTTV